MAQSLSNVLIHIVFSTKNRNNSIHPSIEKELHCYLMTICSSLKCNALDVGGDQDHVHIICRLARTTTISKLVEKVKSSSSKWIKTKGDSFSTFFWQNGYGAFSTDVSNLSALKKYITNQKKHHLHTNFKDEFRNFLNRYQIGYDERYVWD